MRKIIVFSVILFFCLVGLSLAEEKIAIKSFGAAPLYRNLQSAEQLKQILIENEEAMKQAINDAFLSQFLFDAIKEDRVEIREEWIPPGTDIIWMTYAGKKYKEVRILRNAEWVGDKSFPAFVIYLDYDATDGENMYRERARFMAPKPCGNFSLLSITRTLIKPEPEPEPEQVRPKPKPEPEPPSWKPRQIPYRPPVEIPSTYPSRITPKKDNLRFKVLYPFEPKLSFELPADFKISNKLEDYFGDWDCYTWDGNWIHLWTETELEYEIGDIVSLYEMREMTQTHTGFPFGLEVELRIGGNIWIGGEYGQSGITILTTIEEADFVEFEEFEEVTGQYQYEMKLNRFSLVQEASEKFYFRNAQAYIKAEFSGYELTKWFIGIGVDFLQVNQEVEKKEESCELGLWTGKVINEEMETFHTKQSEWITRPFVLAGVGIDVAKGLQLGAEGRVFFESKQFEYEKSSIFIVEGESGSWLIKTPFYSLRVFLAFSF